MSKVLKVIIVMNAFLVVVGAVFGIIYYIFSRKPTPSVSDPDSLSNITQGDIQPWGESMSGVNKEGNSRMRASFKSARNGIMKVVLLNGEEKIYKMPKQIFYLCLNRENEGVYEALKEDSDNIADPSIFIDSEKVNTKIRYGEYLEMFLYTHIVNSPTIIKGVVSLECEKS